MSFIQGDCAFVLKGIRDNSIDLTVTSPPYDNLRTYGGYSFNFETIAKELYRVTKEGGVVVWVVNDQTIEGDESGTSFRQALYFKEMGFKLHDTMIYSKNGFSTPANNRYHQVFEYMFVFCKNKLETFNPILDRQNKCAYQQDRNSKIRDTAGNFRPTKVRNYRLLGKRYNIWEYSTGFCDTNYDSLAVSHPAVFPYTLAIDHIKSWSNEGDLILDPMCGSGTTCKAAEMLNRRWIGIEINPEYLKICKKRVEPMVNQIRLTNYL